MHWLVQDTSSSKGNEPNSYLVNTVPRKSLIIIQDFLSSMHPGLEVLSDRKVLFDGILYTKDPISLSDLRYQEAKRNNDKNPLKSAYYSDDVMFNAAGLLFLPTDLGSVQHMKKVQKAKDMKERLMIMKGAINDERIPTVVEHRWLEKGTPYPCGNSYDYEYHEQYGRDEILRQVIKYHFTPAIPEISKAVMDSICPLMKAESIKALALLGGREAADTLVHKLEDKDDFVMIRDAAATGLTGFSYASSVPALVRTFDGTVFISPWELYGDEKELWGGGDRDSTNYGYGYQINKKIMNDDWLPMICLEALAKIPAPEAMQTLERAANIGFKNTSEHARYCMSNWIDTNVNILQKQYDKEGRLSGQGLERLYEMRRLAYEYDLTPKKKIYDTPFGMMIIRKKPGETPMINMGG